MNIPRLLHLIFSSLVALSPALVPQSRGQTTEDAFRQLAITVPFVSYGDFIYGREPYYYDRNQEVARAWDALQAVMKSKPPFEELAKLVRHDDPKVRTLALLGLFDREEQKAFR